MQRGKAQAAGPEGEVVSRRAQARTEDQLVAAMMGVVRERLSATRARELLESMVEDGVLLRVGDRFSLAPEWQGIDFGLWRRSDDYSRPALDTRRAVAA